MIPAHELLSASSFSVCQDAHSEQKKGPASIDSNYAVHQEQKRREKEESRGTVRTEPVWEGAKHISPFCFYLKCGSEMHEEEIKREKEERKGHAAASLHFSCFPSSLCNRHTQKHTRRKGNRERNELGNRPIAFAHKSLPPSLPLSACIRSLSAFSKQFHPIGSLVSHVLSLSFERQTQGAA